MLISIFSLIQFYCTKGCNKKEKKSLISPDFICHSLFYHNLLPAPRRHTKYEAITRATQTIQSFKIRPD